MRFGHCVLLVPVVVPWCGPTEKEPAPEEAMSIRAFVADGGGLAVVSAGKGAQTAGVEQVRADCAARAGECATEEGSSIPGWQR